jgi:hypothetical protein
LFALEGDYIGWNSFFFDYPVRPRKLFLWNQYRPQKSRTKLRLVKKE